MITHEGTPTHGATEAPKSGDLKITAPEKLNTLHSAFNLQTKISQQWCDQDVISQM